MTGITAPAGTATIATIATPERRCGTCRYWTEQERGAGDCDWHMSNLPLAMRKFVVSDTVWDDEGADCLTWGVRR